MQKYENISGVTVQNPSDKCCTMGSMVAQWLVRLPHSQKILGPFCVELTHSPQVSKLPL